MKPNAKEYKNYIYYNLADGTFLVNLPDRKTRKDCDIIFKTEAEVKQAIDRHIGDPCEYCDMENKPMAYRFDGIYKEKIYVQHLIPAKSRPNGQWIIKAEVASGPIYANIEYCPMCGRKLNND